MIIVRIVGGLGNQMFQYAYAKSLQQQGFEVQIDISKFKTYTLHGGYQLDKYKIDLDTADEFSTFLGKIKLKKNIREKSLLFDEKLFRLSGNEYVKGYFQTEKYFKEIRAILLEQFTIQQKLSETIEKLQQNDNSNKDNFMEATMFMTQNVYRQPCKATIASSHLIHANVPCTVVKKIDRNAAMSRYSGERVGGLTWGPYRAYIGPKHRAHPRGRTWGPQGGSKHGAYCHGAQA